MRCDSLRTGTHNHQGSTACPILISVQTNTMTPEQLEQFRINYAKMVVDGMDMKSLELFAIEMVEQNMKDWDETDIKEEILDYYGEETLMDLMPESEQESTEIGKLEATAPDYGVGK